jgi:GH24 family phage-related lysozyme (muramidase)
MANVKYVAYGTVRVSRRWRKVLRAADRAKVGFHVTSGHRTLAEQERLFESNMVQVGARWVQRAGHPLTAFPSPDAPHIFQGRHAHAIDVNALDGGEARLQKWLESHGVRMSNPVPGEAWHMVANPHDLMELAAKLNDDGTWTAQRMSSKGIEFLIREEGIVLYAYNDPAGHATFGVGHLLHLGGVTAADRAKWGTKARPKSREFAVKVFQDDLKGYEATVRAAVGRRLSQNQFDAFTSMCFNIGKTGFANSTAARRSRQRKPKLAADAMMLWDKPSILRARRERERRLFLTGRYK